MDTVPPDVLARLEPALSELVAFAFCFLALPMVSFLAAATAQWDFEFNVLGWKKLLVSLARSYSWLLLATFYRVIGFWKFQRCAQPFVWIGVNPITIYFGGKFHGERH